MICVKNPVSKKGTGFFVWTRHTSEKHFIASVPVPIYILCGYFANDRAPTPPCFVLDLPNNPARIHIALFANATLVLSRWHHDGETGPVHLSEHQPESLNEL